MTAQDFPSLGLSEPLLRALAARNYTVPTPIQARAIPHLLEGRDLLGIAQTGTGKTAAFALPMLQLLHAANRRPQPKMPRALVLAPTRELATQIADSCDAYGKNLRLRTAIVFGGVGQTPQVHALQRGVDILVATPGRLLDLIQQRHCNLADVEILVLDEADRMLDMGFLPDVRRILATLPGDRQSLLFSATMPNDITSLAGKYLRDPVRVEVTPPAATADRVEQSVYMVPKAGKRDLLIRLLSDPQFERTLVFTRTKHGADRVVKELRKANIESHAIHGNKSQNARERALDQFRDGTATVLVATDIAARGIDVPEITHVINFELPNIPESYVHRIGRTARAGRDGIAISFCDGEEREFLRDIEKLIRKRIPVAGNEIKDRAQAAAHRPAPVAPAAATRTAPAANPWQPQPQPHQPAAPQDEFGAAIDDATDAPATAERPAKQHRLRPDPRTKPGPYAPDPRRQNRPPQPQLPRHERNRKGPSGRPAMPNAVDPEQRRNQPGPMDRQYDERQADQQPRRAPQQQPQRPPQRQPHQQQRRPGQRPQRSGGGGGGGGQRSRGGRR